MANLLGAMLQCGKIQQSCSAIEFTFGIMFSFDAVIGVFIRVAMINQLSTIKLIANYFDNLNTF